ncbi:MAG: hypothetical protein EXQ79_08250 [Acidimicrobiia bacterium]|nr:hypothetical protein [Acidimicrobiia bacterium]
MHGTTLRRLLLALLLVGAVGFATQATAFADAPARRHTAAVDKKKKKKPTIKVADSSLGEIVVTGKGQTVYAFDLDTGTGTDETACGAGCDSTWPPVEAKKPKAGKGIDATMLLVNANGQVSYNGHLLYMYAGDSASGDTNGDGIGGVWHAVGSDGVPLS